jgi:tetraacyldisaccharide-1-P 4'-kinase
LLSLVRKFLYRIGLLSTYHFDVAVVVVGNITVGGSGKTPIVELGHFLKKISKLIKADILMIVHNYTKVFTFEVLIMTKY